MDSIALAASALTIANAAEFPSWAPVVFGIGALALLLLVIVVARRKIQHSESWRRDDAENTGEQPPHPESDDDFRNPHSG